MPPLAKANSISAQKLAIRIGLSRACVMGEHLVGRTSSSSVVPEVISAGHSIGWWDGSGVGFLETLWRFYPTFYSMTIPRVHSVIKSKRIHHGFVVL